MKQILFAFSLIWLASACELLNDSSKSYELEEIDELYNEIAALSESVPCTNSSEWKFTPMGSKACGGPSKYIAYHQSVEKKFQELVDQYTFQQQEYNRKNNIVSDCMLVAPPRSVTCEGNKPILVY